MEVTNQVSNFVYNPTYKGVMIHLLSTMDIPVRGCFNTPLEHPPTPLPKGCCLLVGDQQEHGDVFFNVENRN